MKRWRRTATAVPIISLPPVPPCVSVLSVTADGDGNGVWIFSDDIFDINSIANLDINDGGPVGVVENSGPLLRLAYVTVVGPDQTWDATAAVGDIDFVGGGALCPGQQGFIPA